jgi:hypothetical protein
MATSHQWDEVPANPACMPAMKCWTRKILAIQSSHAGVLSDPGECRAAK